MPSELPASLLRDPLGVQRLVDEPTAVELLKLGEVVAAATESSFGLLANADDPRALDRLFACKPRAAKGVGLILPDAAAWQRWVTEIPATARELAEELWPGALTLVLAARPGVDPRLTEAGTVGVRVAGASTAARLAHVSGLTLTATSANPPGAAPAVTLSEALVALPGTWVVFGHAPGGAPSTWISFAGGAPRVLRRGRVALDRFP